MFTCFFTQEEVAYVVESLKVLGGEEVEKLSWGLSASLHKGEVVEGDYIGPRKEIVSPWSTNASEIARNMGVSGIDRIERFRKVKDAASAAYDPMLEAVYHGLNVHTLLVETAPEPLRYITDIAAYNKESGLALSGEEIDYLKDASERFGRSFTDAEIFGFAQINSEHCRHKIFNGSFVIDGKEKEKSLFALIKETSKRAGHNLVSAYKDNVAFVKGPEILQFAPSDPSKASEFEVRPIRSVISLKAETHNFPTTVEPFNGASTGSGGEIRDRMGGGRGSIPLVGSACYMTAYPRLDAEQHPWEAAVEQRRWKYQTPQQILTKASNGASDFGNKFGQPLIVGSLLTFEGKVKVDGKEAVYGYDRTIMLAGGVGYANEAYAQKHEPRPGDKIVLLGGDNYRIGMAGGSVSSVSGGEYAEALELSAVQRANPEMQKRVYNVIRALAEKSDNPVVLIHDHGAGGHINCLSELVDPQGGTIELRALPVGDPTLSVKEIICNESQERMGLVVAAEDIPMLEEIARRERSPMYVVGEIIGDKHFRFIDSDSSQPVDLPLDFLFGSSPKTVLEDKTASFDCGEVPVAVKSGSEILASLKQVLSLEGVACKDWLTNKVDRSVTGRVALQQCAGPLQLPLNDCGVVALDYQGKEGIASSLGATPVAGLADAKKGSRLSVAEALTNLLGAPIKGGLSNVALSANWMWPAKQAGENARLYEAVESLSKFCIELGVPVPTGKDSLSMTMNYKDGRVVRAPGTVVVSAAGECEDVKICVGADIKPVAGTKLVAIDLSGLPNNVLGGSSFAQTKGVVGNDVPDVVDPVCFARGFELVQELVREGVALALHDISSGGLITTICEMAFGGNCGAKIVVPGKGAALVEKLFTEKPGVVVQIREQEASAVISKFKALQLQGEIVGEPTKDEISLEAGEFSFSCSTEELLRVWYEPSHRLDRKQTESSLADERFETCAKNPLDYKFPAGYSGDACAYGINGARTAKSGIKAAIIREKGTNGDREMAFAMFAAGFDVKDVTMYDLTTGHETLEDVNFIVFPGGFSNSDVLGSAKGWAGGFKYSQKAVDALTKFFARPDTLSLGVCNGCQLAVELNLIYPEHEKCVTMNHNRSKKFESKFLAVDVHKTKSVLLKPLEGSRLGIWVAHGEGRFSLPMGKEAYDIALTYAASDYPANPNGSDFDAAGIVSQDGRHLAMMPHLERAVFPWQWGYYPHSESHEVAPWFLCFKAAFDWVRTFKK